MTRLLIPWKETLLDNLLLFAATPKGLLFDNHSLDFCHSSLRHVSIDTNGVPIGMRDLYR